MKKSNLITMFCLEGLLLDKIENKKNEIYLHVRSPRQSAICPHCGASTGRVHKVCFRKIKHSMLDGKIINLNLKVRSFYCKKRNHYFRESIPGIDRRGTSFHFRKNIIPKLRDRSFRAVAHEHNLSISNLMRQAVSLINERDICWPKGKFMLGLDEHSFSGHDMMITVTDLTNHNVLAVLKDDNKSTLRKFIQNIPENAKENIICACTDMRRMYFNIVREEMGNKAVVIDKFHVIRFFNKHLDQLRQAFTSSKYPLPKKLLEKNKEDLDEDEKKIMAVIFKKYPPIEELWRLKEFVRKMYRIKDPKKAKQAFQVILDGLEFDGRPRWEGIYKTLTRWQEEILNYFEYKITNAYTEGVHTRMKLLKRISYGFKNKINYIAKVTLAFLPLATLVQMMETSPSLT